MKAVNLTYKDFRRNLNTSFQLAMNDSSVAALDLVEVSDLKESPLQERFSVIFRGPLDVPLMQGLYNLSHETIGEFELFMVPVGKKEDAFLYEAVFNRSKDPEKA